MITKSFELLIAEVEDGRITVLLALDISLVEFGCRGPQSSFDDTHAYVFV